MKRLICLIALMATLLTTLCYAQTSLYNDLFSAKTLKCETNYVHSAEFEKKWKFKGEKSKMSFIFDNIDITNGNARFIASQGSTDVGVLASNSGILFLETTPGGTPQTSYVFNIQDDSGKFLFIHSRRTSIFETAVPYYFLSRVRP